LRVVRVFGKLIFNFPRKSFSRYKDYAAWKRKVLRRNWIMKNNFSQCTAKLNLFRESLIEFIPTCTSFSLSSPFALMHIAGNFSSTRRCFHETEEMVRGGTISSCGTWSWTKSYWCSHFLRYDASS
jgi:hypothetical protein